ncbi:uncharacterized protein si:ch211-13c6.2 isoform X2 [Cheilinus undulatus]|nr:uncharacterized protein si:ch211-13c6.2 isoform X2 [Cheilinus undulatus]
MKLDEPIIGLNYLEELPSNDLLAGPKYTCLLCHQTANLHETVRHVIGRKHRQKYVEMKRPDLVTWDKQSITNQAGKIIRARAEIIERQDGRGTPVTLPKKRKVGQSNISRAPQRQNQNWGRNVPQSLTKRDIPSRLPHVMTNQDEYFHQERLPPRRLNTPPFHPEEPPYVMNRDRQKHQQDNALSHHGIEEGLPRADYRDQDLYREEYMDPDYRRGYKGEDSQRRALLEPAAGPRYGLGEEMHHDSAQCEDNYPDEAPPYRKPYQERDLLKEFYTEEVRRQQARSAEHQPSVKHNVEDHRWSLDRDPLRHEGKVGRQGPTEAEAKRRSFPSQMGDDRVFNMIREYPGDIRQPPLEEAVVSPGPSRMGASQPQRQVEVSKRQVEVTRTLADVPEPFRRFLQGPSNEGQENRKRKSRFSDATAEEVETMKELFSDELGPPEPKFPSRPRPVSVPLRPETHRTQHPDLYIQPQSTRQTDRDPADDSDSAGVFEMLRDVEIENAEEANYLKSKLCDLLKDFKSKKSEKAAGLNSQGRVVMSRDLDSFNTRTPEPAPRHLYEPAVRLDSDHRRPEELYFPENHRRREEFIPDKRPQEIHHGEHRRSERNQFEDLGWQENLQTPHSSLRDEPASYSERLPEPRYTRDYRHAAPKFSVSPPRFDQGPRRDRSPRYMNKMDKITSTLLELVSRK